MSKKLIIANWKANPPTLHDALELARNIERAASAHRRVEVIVAPPFPFLAEVASVLKRAKRASQNTFWGDVGPYTGEVSWRQLKSLNVTHVIVGHSERRMLLGETDEMVNKKVQALLEHGLIPILCVGERERSGGEMPEDAAQQLKSALAGVKKVLVKNLIIAYEPVWAISTAPGSSPDTPESVFRAHVYIKKVIAGLFGRPVAERVKIIYGGSVNAHNILSFLIDGHMHGALVGGASLNAEEFAGMIKIASSQSLPLINRSRYRHGCP
ncbi:MAG: triose-phosphate isomerase [Candidatus Sungbacteria bacterium]|nr:triose-phosphate isomerase [Candidatus Sungbacteria bacterium]